MLGNADVVANVAVKDMSKAKAFYEGVLGLESVERQEDQVTTYRSGQTKINVYVSDFAGTNKATTLTWAVPDAKAAAATLASKGVRFEHYDMPGITREGDVHVGYGMKSAWFKDPDGNILQLLSQ
jgi:catechol 2,3-dioxygenase-like lactoylglutathione lyase family enzyme